ncbi:MAG: PEP-CTERM sorting domain-containing protein [Deferrisomatales bacterium]|nr:PEP-CTERM sorting domain-containing protein [Deferrisomatales bacterium]
MARSAFQFELIILLALALLPCRATAVSFSLDPASPSIDGNATPDDILLGGSGVHVQGSNLGLAADLFWGFYDNLDALSYGADPLGEPLLFSVDRLAVGLPGTAVGAEAGSLEASGDIFRNSPSGTNSLEVDEETLGLAPGFFGDDLNALAFGLPLNGLAYFSIDSLSASNGFGALGLADDILMSGGTGSFQIFADGVTNMGLLDGDDLDALLLWDVFEPGTLNPGVDAALFSLSPFSWSGWSPGDILLTDFSGGHVLYASAADLGLDFFDDVNALSAQSQPIPEPGTLVLFGTGLAGILGWGRRRRTQ